MEILTDQWHPWFDEIEEGVRAVESLYANTREQASHEFFWEPISTHDTAKGDNPANKPSWDNAGVAGAAPSSGLVPINSNPAFSSNPGAPVTLFLDFDGHFEPSWGGYSNATTPVYDIDGDATTFSETELARMQTAWEAVSEDFAPYNVNVTTVEPTILGDGNTSNDNGIALRVAIGGSWEDWYGSSAGGVGYINSFTSSIPNVVYVFSDSTSSLFGETSSHEAGHGFGLYHQSTYDAGGALIDEYNPGTSQWQPIMGGGTSSLSITSTWHNGRNSNGPFSYQDDLAVLNSAISYRTDDHSNGTGGATPLLGNAGSGIIETDNDVDVFSFSITGGEDTYRIRVDGAEIEQNLDAVLEVRSASGELIASSNPNETLDAQIVVALTAGDYFVAVSKSSVYGYLGQYTVNIDTQPAGVTVSSASETLTTSEAGQTASFDVVLDTKPTANVLINVSSSDPMEGTPSQSLLIFNSSNWNVPQTIIITAVDDADVELPASYGISLGPITSADSEYDGRVVADIALVNQDDDAPGWVFALQGEDDVRVYETANGPSGNVYMSGRFGGTVDFDLGPGTYSLTAQDSAKDDGFIAKYNSAGDLIWVQTFGGIDGYETSRGIDFDSAGNVFLIGYSSAATISVGSTNITNQGGYDAFLTKIDANGNFQWARSWGGSANDYAYGIAVAPDDSIHVAGYFYETADFDPGVGTYQLTSADSSDAYLLNLDTNGNFVSAFSITGASYENIYRVDTDNNGDVYLAGRFNETSQFGMTDGNPVVLTSANGTADTFLMKVSLDGASINTEWVRQVAGTDPQNTARLVVDGDGGVYFTDYFKGVIDIDDGYQGIQTLASAGNYDSLITKWDSDGNLDWYGQISSVESNKVSDIQLDSDHNAYFVGYFYGTASIEIGAQSQELTSQVSQDTFVLKLGSNGSIQHVAQIVQQAISSNRSIAVDNGGNVYVAADFEENVAFPTGDDLASTDGGTDDSFLLKLAFAPGININPTAGLVTTENGASTSFDVSLDTRPTADVTIALTSSDTSEGTVSPTSLTFTPGNWSVAQTVTISGVDDATVDGDVVYWIVTAAAVSGDSGYSGLNPADVSVTNMDNEFLNEVVFADSFEVSEWNGLWVEDYQNDWRRQTQRATDGNYSAEVDGRATDATLTVANSIDMSPYGTAELTFDWYIESGFDSGEYVKLEFYDGNSWTEILSLDGNVDQENTWHNEIVDLDSQYLNADFKFRFRAKASRSNEDANVDNVQLLATSLVAPPNATPTANNDAFNVDEDNSLVVDAGMGVLDNDSDPDTDPLTAVLVAGPANAKSFTLNNDGSFTYTPEDDFYGGDSFTYMANDGTADSNVATVLITVDPVNDAPIATDDNDSTAEDTPLVISVASLLGNDNDVDPLDTLSISNFTQPINGSLVDNNNGSLTYSPDANYNGSDLFSYTVSDGNGGFDTANVFLTISQFDDAGSFGGDLTATISEDVMASGTATFADANDGFNSPNFSLNSSATHGIATIDPNGDWGYTPNANYHGADSFEVAVTDDDGNLESQIISIAVTSVTDLAATDDAFFGNEDTPLTGNVGTNDTTTSGGPLNFTVDSVPNSGSLDLNADGSFGFTPNVNFNGSDSFTYTVTDSAAGESDTRTVSITIASINDAGLFAGDLSGSTDEDTTVAGTATFTDPADGFSTANFVLSSSATNGVGSIDANGNWSYTPNAAFFGADSFEISVTDDDGNVEFQVISLTVNEVTDLTADDDFYSIDEDGSLSGDVSSNDSTTSGGTLSFVVDSGPANGTLIEFNIDGSFTYQPDANFNGNDSFTYTVNDSGSDESSAQTVSITINQVDDSGSFGGDLSATTNEDTSVGGTVTFTDSLDGNSAPGFVVSGGGSNGSASVDSSGNWIYTPDANYYGSDSIVVSVTDDDGNVESQIISISITPVADLSAADDGFSGSEDTAIVGNVGSNDSTTSGGTLNFAVDSGPTFGSLGLSADGSFSYTPDSNFHGNDSFTYTVTDAVASESGTRTVNITVSQVNDGGTFGGDLAATTAEDTQAAGSVTFTDTADGDLAPGFVITNSASNGVAVIGATGNWTYMPDANYHGADSFEVSVTDDDGNNETQVISLTITPVADLMSADDAVSGDEDTLLVGDASSNDSTTSGGTLSYSVDSGPSDGQLYFNSDGSFTYQPNSDFNGSDSFTYVVTDASSSEFDTQTVSITVDPVNDAPIAVADSYAIDQDTTLNISAPGVVADDSDVDDDPLSAVLVAGSGPDHGSLTLNADGSFDYTPEAGYFGADSFVYVANDGFLDSHPTTVSITVNEVMVNSGPKLAYGVESGVGGSWVTVNLPYTYASMVVVATANYDDTSGPGVVRIQNASGNSFEVMAQAAGGAALSNISVHYTVMEEGVYNEAGFKLEAVKFNSTRTDENNSWAGESRSYGQSYANPVVVGQVMTYNDADWSNFWARGSSRTAPPTSSSLYVGKMVGEDADNTRADETIGYFVIESSSSGVIEGLPFRAGLGGDSVKGVDDAPAYQYSYNPFAGGIPKAAVVSMAGMDGGNGGWAVLYGNEPLPTAGGGGDLYLAIDEDQSKDSERRHTTEQVAYFVIDPPVETAVEELSIELPEPDHDLSRVVRHQVDWSNLTGVGLPQHFESSMFDQQDEQPNVDWRKSLLPIQMPALKAATESSVSADAFFEEHDSMWIDHADPTKDKFDFRVEETGEFDAAGLDDLFGSDLVDGLF